MKKPTTQEVEDLIKYCTDKERSVPKPYKWVEVMKIIEYEKIEKHYQKTLQCLILGAWNFASEIMRKEKKFLLRGGKFITHVPKVKIIRPK